MSRRFRFRLKEESMAKQQLLSSQINAGVQAAIAIWRDVEVIVLSKDQILSEEQLGKTDTKTNSINK